MKEPQDSSNENYSSALFKPIAAVVADINQLIRDGERALGLETLRPLQNRDPLFPESKRLEEELEKLQCQTDLYAVSQQV